MLAAEDLRSHPSPARIAAVAIALIVIAVPIAFVAVGLAVMIHGSFALEPLLLGLLSIAVGILLRPRIARLDREGAVTPEQAPELHALVERIAAALGARPPDVVALTTAYNASWSTGGLLRRRRLALGVPLLAVLGPRERVAVIAHELGHDVNGDASRGAIVGSALQTLYSVHAALEGAVPGGGMDTGGWVDDAMGLVVIATLLAKPLVALLGLPVRAAYRAELLLLLDDSRRAEFLADALAARTAGTAAVIALHERMLLAGFYDAWLQRAVTSGEDRIDLGELRAEVADLPPDDLERRLGQARKERTRLAATQPPLAARIAVLQGRPGQPTVWLETGVAARLDAELGRLEPRVARQAVSLRRDAMYAGSRAAR
jgi:heat shock protein HtpX